MSTENKQPLPCRKIKLNDPKCPEPVKPLIDRLMRILPTDHLDMTDATAEYWTVNDDYLLKIELHADVDLRFDSRDPLDVCFMFRHGYKHEDKVAKALLEALYCRPAVEFARLLTKIQHYEWDWRGPPQKLLAKRTEEKVYCEHDYGEDQPRRLEIPNDKYDRALAALNSIGLEEADWVSYGSYYESGHLEHTAAWGVLDVEARGDGSLWYKSLKYDFDSRAWIPVKDGPTLRGIIEAQKNMTFVDFYDKYLTFQDQGTTGADGPPMSAAAAP